MQAYASECRGREAETQGHMLTERGWAQPIEAETHRGAGYEIEAEA